METDEEVKELEEELEKMGEPTKKELKDLRKTLMIWFILIVAGTLVVIYYLNAMTQTTNQSLPSFLDLDKKFPVDLYENESGAFRIVMPYDIESKGQMYKSPSPNGQLIIYHQGHATYGWLAGNKTIDFFLEQGYDVFGLGMILRGLNSQNTSKGYFCCHRNLSQKGNGYAYKDDVYNFPKEYGNSLRFFLQPTLSVLDLHSKEYDEVHMIGISGGGWTALMISALDDRITNSYEVAGTLPTPYFAYRDYEQQIPEFYNQFSFEKLYYLAGNSGRHVQILNHDQLFPAQSYLNNPYEDRIYSNFEVWIDENKIHSISEWTLGEILYDLER